MARQQLRRALFRRASLGAFALFGACAFAPTSVVAGVAVESLQRFFDQVETFEARFTQVVLDEDLNAIDDGRGTVWIKRPGRFRWDYEPPDAQEIVGDGERVWLYDIALEQVTVRDQSRALGRTPAILLAADGEINGHYEVEEIGTQGRFDWVNLIPIDSHSGFAEVRIGFEDRVLRLMELIDTLDQRTRISFAAVTENAALADRIFEFAPPDGVDVIDQSELD
ncbi:MAG: outer membrane lipoprotein chaperone LolA [bacterium]